MHRADAVRIYDTGAATTQGGRVSQEDRHVVLLPHQFPKTESTDNFALFGTYDGHGSAEVSEHVRQNLPTLLVKRPEFADGDYETAMIRAFEDEDNLLLRQVMEDNTQPVVSGSTVALCLVNLTRGLLVIGNVGDSHIALARRDEGSEFITWQERLTVAHKPNDPPEKSRIEQAGGAVHIYGGTARLGTLNMSRALGDLQYKNPINTLNFIGSTRKARRANAHSSKIRGNILSNEAYVRTVRLDQTSRYTLLCSTDGVTDVTDEKQLMKEVVSDFVAGRKAVDIARMVTTATGEQPYSDNSTCVIAFLNGVRS